MAGFTLQPETGDRKRRAPAAQAETPLPRSHNRLGDARTTENPIRDFRARRVEKSPKERLY